MNADQHDELVNCNLPISEGAIMNYSHHIFKVCTCRQVLAMPAMVTSIETETIPGTVDSMVQSQPQAAAVCMYASYKTINIILHVVDAGSRSTAALPLSGLRKFSGHCS
jgi:hypothetical protein